MKKTLTAMLMAAAAQAAMAGGDKQPDGLAYSLPKTAVRMAVLVEKTTTEPGQLADFAELYFKTSATTTRQTSYRIVGVSFSSFGQPDSERRYVVPVDRKHSVLSIDCDANGVLRAINCKAPKAKQPQPFRPAPQPAQLNPRDYMSQDILAAGNLPKMAQLVAQEIYDVRDSRNQLSRGEADNMPKDGEQLRLMYRQLDNQEHALMQLFQGTTTVDTTETVVTFVPEKEQPRKVAFRFSRRFGLTTPDDYSGEPYYVTTDDEGIQAELPADADAAAREKDEFKLGVCLPGRVRLTLAAPGGKPLAYYETDAAQYGRVELLNGALFGRKFTSQITLDPATGGVVELKTEPLE